MMVSRRRVLGTLGALGAGAGLGALWWQRQSMPAAVAATVATNDACAAFAGSRIRWVVPHSAGGGYDAESRLIEPFLERRLQADVAIENLPGASGLIGARAIASARPDGRTLGIIGAPGMLVSALIDTARTPGGSGQAIDVNAFTILGRVSRSWHVWATGRDSSIRTLDGALKAAQTRPLVFALSEVGGVNFVSVGVTAALLHAPIAMVPGFSGSQAAALAAIRGDVDLVSFDFEAIRDLIGTGELRPLLQISDRAIDPHPSLAGVPVLGGPQGWLAVDRDREMTTALIALISAGRIVVAPPGLDPAVAGCLDRALYDTLSSDALRAAATRPLDIGTGEQARADALAAASGLAQLREPLQAALKSIRG